MTWEGSDRRSRLPADWLIVRAKVLKRDRRMCQVSEEGRRCGRYANEVDHIVNNDDHSMANLQAICRYHHGIKTALEGNRAQKRYSRNRPPEPHPGMRKP